MPRRRVRCFDRPSHHDQPVARSGSLTDNAGNMLRARLKRKAEQLELPGHLGPGEIAKLVNSSRTAVSAAIHRHALDYYIGQKPEKDGRVRINLKDFSFALRRANPTFDSQVYALQEELNIKADALETTRQRIVRAAERCGAVEPFTVTQCADILNISRKLLTKTLKAHQPRLVTFDLCPVLTRGPMPMVWSDELALFTCRTNQPLPKSKVSDSTIRCLDWIKGTLVCCASRHGIREPYTIYDVMRILKISKQRVTRPLSNGEAPLIAFDVGTGSRRIWRIWNDDLSWHLMLGNRDRWRDVDGH